MPCSKPVGIVEVADHDREAAPLVLRARTSSCTSARSVWPPMLAACCRKSNTLKMRALAARRRQPVDRAGRANGMIATRSRFARPTYASAARDLHRVVQLRRGEPIAIESRARRRGCRCGGPLLPRTGAAAACRGGRRGSSRCSGSRRRARSCGDRRTRCPQPTLRVRRSARSAPENTLRETMCRYSSFFRNRSSNSSCDPRRGCTRERLRLASRQRPLRFLRSP